MTLFVAEMCKTEIFRDETTKNRSDIYIGMTL